ncbi:hypothetical protein T649_27900 [Pseudomonas aeruginosa MRSN 321]|nr:hypothetical protein T649_27900 [Pseudomonas aeruginosa MRSN 321]
MWVEKKRLDGYDQAHWDRVWQIVLTAHETFPGNVEEGPVQLNSFAGLKMYDELCISILCAIGRGAE